MSSAIPKGSLVLVTGVNGFIGSHVADQFLEAGYRVRGTTRSLEKVKDLKALWEKKFGPTKVEFVVVPDISSEGAFDEAVKGVSGIAHVASILTFSPDPNKVIPAVINSINSILNSAANEASVKRFVYTSSSTAATAPIPNKVFTIDSNSWNEAQVKEAWAPPPYEPQRAWAVYGASKTQGEQAVWKFVEEQKPHFVANAVLPNWNIGKILTGKPGSTNAWITNFYNGEVGLMKTVPPQWFVDVQDVARLHVSALTNPSVENERLFAFAESFNYHDLLRIFHKLRPNKKLLEPWSDDNSRDLSIVKNERALELLQKDFGQPSWTSLETSISYAIEGL